MKNAAFTLIELLVVIAITAVLAAILFPVFAQAWEKSRQTQCASNTKQISIGVLLYIQDYDETLTPTAIVSANTGGVLWPDLILPYIKNDQVRLCPSDANGKKDSYGLNEIAFPDLTDPANLQTSIITLGAFQHPSETVMTVELGTADDYFTDRPNAYKSPPPSFPLNDDADARPAARHFHQMNIGFMDGHQKLFRFEQFYFNQTPTDKWYTP